jgi:hypothetical protein
MRDLVRRPDFRLLFGGLVASMTAESILLLALAIWVKDLTGSDGMAGATIFAVVAPMTLAPIVGWVVDRFRRRPFFIAANLVTAVLLSPLFAVHDRGDVWIAYVVAALYGLSYIALSATLNGLIQEIVPGGSLARPTARCRPSSRGCGWSGRWPARRCTPGSGVGRSRRSARAGSSPLRGRSPACGYAKPSRRPRSCAGSPRWGPEPGTCSASRRCAGPSSERR